MEVIIDAKQHAAVIDSAYLASVRSYIDRKAVVGVLTSHNKLKSKGGAEEESIRVRYSSNWEAAN